MGQGCSKCQVGNPCTDTTCNTYGSRHLRDLLEKVRDKWEDFQESVRAEEQNQKWLEDVERRYEERKGISADGFKYYANNVRRYLDKPQPKIDALCNVENRLVLCLDGHKEGERLECSDQVQELKDLATAGRDPPEHCRGRADVYSCTFASTSWASRGAAAAKGAAAHDAERKAYSFGTCYS